MKSFALYYAGIPMGGKTATIEKFQKNFSKIKVENISRINPPSLKSSSLEATLKIQKVSEIINIQIYWNSGSVFYREEVLKYHLKKVESIIFVAPVLSGKYYSTKEEWRLLHRHLDREIPIVLAFNQIDIIEDMGIHPKDRIFASKSGIDPDNITDPIQIPYRQEGEVRTRDATPFEHTFIKAYEKMLDPKGRYPHFYTSALLGYNIDQALFKLVEMMEARQREEEK